MRVLSGLADLDFHMGAITREGDQLRVESRPGSGIPTVVYVERADVVAALHALLRSPRALLYIAGAALHRRRTGAASPAPGAAPRDETDINNPWR